MIKILEMVENTLGKGENAGNQHFLLFPKCLQKPSSSGSFKVMVVCKRVRNKHVNLTFNDSSKLPVLKIKKCFI